MAYNVTAGRLRHSIGICKQSDELDHNGQPTGFTVPKKGYAEVLTRSGGENAKYGAVVSDTVITALMWENSIVDHDSFVLFKGEYYSVLNISPDESGKGMVVTAKVER